MKSSRTPAQLAGDLLDIAREDRREIGIGHGGVAAPDQLHQRADLMADRDLGEADLARDRGDALLMVADSDSHA